MVLLGNLEQLITGPNGRPLLDLNRRYVDRAVHLSERLMMVTIQSLFKAIFVGFLAFLEAGILLDLYVLAAAYLFLNRYCG